MRTQQLLMLSDFIQPKAIQQIFLVVDSVCVWWLHTEHAASVR